MSLPCGANLNLDAITSASTDFKDSLKSKLGWAGTFTSASDLKSLAEPFKRTVFNDAIYYTNPDDLNLTTVIITSVNSNDMFSFTESTVIGNNETVEIHSYPDKKISVTRFYIHARNIAAGVLFLLEKRKVPKKKVKRNNNFSFLKKLFSI